MRRILLAVALSALLAGRAAGQCPDPLPPDPGVRELRLGLVFYGGISLAIYMYGTTREIHHLLLASDALELDARATPTMQAGSVGAHGAGLAASARHYYQLLSDKWRKDGVRTRVVVDTISGTSAGGINGIILAKAIATNGPIDGLRKLWFDEADIVKLAGGRPWTVKAVWRLLRKKPALTGDGWLRQLYAAFEDMDGRPKSSPSASLLPCGSQLDLLVPSTDYYGSQRVVEVGDPPTSHDRYHNQVFHFQFPDRQRQESVFAGPTANATLAFAARSSASFPVAFPPTSIQGLIDAIPEAKLNGTKLAQQVFRYQLLDRGTCGKPGTPEEDCAPVLAKGVFLVDGGVLDNYPLGIAFQRAGRTTPPVPAQRVFLYLEPDPAAPPLESSAAEIKSAPNSWQMFWGASSTIPGNEPIAEDFKQLARHNERVDRILDVLARNELQARLERGSGPLKPGDVTVASLVEDVVNYDLDRPKPLDLRPWLSWDQQAPLSRMAIAYQRWLIEQDAAAAQPVAEEAYMRLRLHSVLDQLARNLASDVCALPESYEGPRATLARAIVFQWAAASGLKDDARRRNDFLTAWDLGYLRRNLRFVLAWIDYQYPGGKSESPYKRLTAHQLELAHTAVRRAIDQVSALVRADNLGALVGEPADLARLHGAVCVKPESKPLIGEQAEALVAEHRQLLDGFVDRIGAKLSAEQDRIRGELFEQFVAQTTDWKDEQARRAVLARYMGFPYWDRVAYPYTAFSGTGELARANVVRLSPRDAVALDGNGADRLSGSRWGHFGAFFHRSGRENDYLWGRLDGAERLSKLLGSSSPPGGIFSKILDEEESEREGRISAEVLSHLRSCVDRPHSCACQEPAP